MMAFIRYTTLRFALLLAVGALMYVFGMRGITLLVVALLASGILSFFVLDRQRDALGATVGGWLSRINAKIDANTRSEDDDAEQ